MRRFLLVSLSALSLSAVVAVPARAAGEDYGEYSRMFSRSAGQFWADGRAAGQWAWKPLSATTSEISWGDPKSWPPDYAEKFVHAGSWVMLDGWRDNGTYYRLRVTKEQIGDAKCGNLRTIATSGPQHYVKWDIPSQAYCLKAWGTLTEESSGKVVDFGHTQIWSPPASCSAPAYGTRRCVKQWESWWDNQGKPGQAITRKLDRDNYLAKGVGMAFGVRQYFPKPWAAEGHSDWTW
ncbi:hypothetical protein [Nonomuraea rhizosphaerae]|uniref:hypothetical protein n=1 Tax=Nonomuraea rhizosphaerae TaxID=2665663 RepID=UPI001C5D3A67|nr:hypothetical protein [Nonomuraea rhizosphaerae]